MKEEEKKKNYNIPPLVIYLTMFLLVFIIILPPVLRLLLPDEEQEVDLPQDRVALLNCNTTQDLPDYTLEINARANYLNEDLTKIVLTYNLAIKDTAPLDFMPDLGIEGFEALSDVLVEEDENITKITITKDAFVNNPSNVLLNQYDKTQREQQRDFESLGYTCSVTTS